jgi:hypothetical protein
MTAAAAPSMTAASAASTTATASMAASRRDSYGSAKRKLIFFIEDIERRQADVRDFLFSEHNSRHGIF